MLCDVWINTSKVQNDLDRGSRNKMQPCKLLNYLGGRADLSTFEWNPLCTASMRGGRALTHERLRCAKGWALLGGV